MRRASKLAGIGAVVALATTQLLAPRTAALQGPEQDLARGIRQVEAGDLEAAVATLDTVVRALSSDKSRSKDLAQAYLYLGIAYVGLDQEKAGRASFREALALDAALRLDPQKHSRRAVRLFEEGRQDAASLAQPSPTPSPTPLATPIPADRRAGETWTNPKDGLEYVWIPAGSFQMGCVPSDAQCYPFERPRHQVTLTRGFWLGRTHVTVGAFERFVSATGHRTEAEKDGLAFAWDGSQWASKRGVSWRSPGFSQDATHPAVLVSWNDASAYCIWSGGRLQTEAEWEYAARGGRDGSIYPWGDDISHERANYGKDSGGPLAQGSDRWEFTSPVASFSANGMGLFDMAGNAWQWTSDWYGENYYGGSSAQDPRGPSSGTQRVLRGGSWDYGPWFLRASYRYWGAPEYRDVSYGCRCARDGT